MKAFIKIVYTVLALGVLIALIDNKFFDGKFTGINKSSVDKTIAFFSGNSYDFINAVAVVHKPEGKYCSYYLKNESGNILIPENLDAKFQKNGMRVRVEWSELIKVQDQCHRGTYIRIDRIEKF